MDLLWPNMSSRISFSFLPDRGTNVSTTSLPPGPSVNGGLGVLTVGRTAAGYDLTVCWGSGRHRKLIPC